MMMGDSNAGRVAAGDQALVSDQAATRLAPSGFDLSRLSFGQPIVPDSPEEWALEERAFRAANNSKSTQASRQLVRDLWFAFVRREEWFAQAMSAGTAETAQQAQGEARQRGAGTACAQSSEVKP